MSDQERKSYEDLVAEVKHLIAKTPQTPEQEREQRRQARISWVAGQCALSDSQGRPIEFWKEKARQAVENLEAEGLL